MKLRWLLAFPLALFACATVPETEAVSKIPITVKGETAEATLALAERRNAIREGERTYTHPDGLLFYFVVRPLSGTRRRPAIREAQNFSVDGEPYWKNAPGAVDSYTVIFDKKSFSGDENSGRVRAEDGDFIQKTIICGDALPAKGIVEYRLFFGFDEAVEEFVFRFKLEDIPR